MKVSRYNPEDMSLLSDSISDMSFGNITLGSFCDKALVIKPIAESETISLLGLYLESNANLDHTRFGSYIAKQPETGIVPGSSKLNNFFRESPGVSDYFMFSDNRITYDTAEPEYTWLDAKVGTSETTLGPSSINFRFVFEYN